MANAKDIIIKPITSSAANILVKKIHYSSKVVPNSQLHFGVFLNGKLEGAMQFGPSMDKRKTLGLVRNTEWNGFLELNRMAFSDVLPRNSESRAIGIAIRLIKKHYPHIEWIISYSDATQCGDGIIYRASGFLLTGIKENKTILKLPDGTIVADKTLNNTNYILKGQSAGWWKKNGAEPLVGYQLRYIFFINKEAILRLTAEVLPFSVIDKLNARMYKGAKRVKEQDFEYPSKLGGATPTHTLHKL